MVHELKKSVEEGRIFFGLKQTLKNSKELNRIFVSSDCRKDVINKLKNQKVDVELAELNKEDLANTLELDFHCEVFGLKK